MELQNIDSLRPPSAMVEYVKEVMLFIKKEYLKTWPKFRNKVNEIISSDETLEEVNVLKDHNHWRRIGISQSNDGNTVYWWKELYTKVLLRIINENGGGISKTKSIQDKINQSKEKRVTVKYGVFPCQDTILPLFFEGIYSDIEFDVEFKTYKDWNDGLQAFLNGEIDVALHNFGTTVAFNTAINMASPLFFWPYFSFNGYSLWVKTKSLKDFVQQHKMQKIPFEKWSILEKKQFFQQSKILVEKNTDFEWVLKEYLKTLDFSTTELKELDKTSICSCNTNAAKNKFVDEAKYTVYVTNPIHTFDLKQGKYRNAFTLVLHGNKFTEHNNFNGLICSMDYYKKNEDVIHKLIEKWFVHTESLKKRINIVTNKNPLDTSKPSVSMTIPALLAFLNKETKSQIKDEHLQYIYSPDYNNFYDSHRKAFKEFYEVELSKENIIQNYIGITQIQLEEGNVDTEIIREAIVSIKTLMTTL